MADQIELNANIKSNIGSVAKDAGDLASEFKIMGVSLNSLKKSFRTLALTAKKSFSTIKKAAMSSGIGALAVALGSVAVFLTKTKKGAELLETAFAGVGAAIGVITDRVSKFGGAIVKLFQRDTKGALKDFKDAFTGIGDEIVKDTKAAIDLKKSFIALRDSERDLNVETAQRRADIEALKLVAEDITKTEKERLDAAKQAFNIENNLLNKRIANAEEALKIQREQMELGENMAEDLDKEADLLINLATIRQESTTKQIELNNKINAIQNEQKAKEEARQVELKRQADEKAKADKEAKEKEIADAKAIADAKIAEEKRVAAEQLALQQAAEQAKQNLISSGFAAASELAGESDKAQKAIAVAKTIYNTQQAIMNAMANVPAPFNIAQAALTGIMGANAIRKILSTSPESNDGGSTTVTAATPATEFVGSGTFQLSNVQPRMQPIQTYVVTDDLTNSQDKLALIRRRATI